MEDYTLGKIESRFADIIWDNAPLSTARLIELCGKELGWKRTTTYTVLKKFSERGIFENVSGTVEVRMSKAEFYARQSECYVEYWLCDMLIHSFGGSLPGFLAAFTSRKKLSEKEITELRRIIDESESI